MTTIAVTGHMNLTEETVPLVRAALRESLAGWDANDLVGVSCIAAGGDSLFAEAVLEAGGRLVVVLPSRDYRERKVKPADAPVSAPSTRRRCTGGARSHGPATRPGTTARPVRPCGAGARAAGCGGPGGPVGVTADGGAQPVWHPWVQGSKAIPCSGSGGRGSCCVHSSQRRSAQAREM